VIWRMTVETFTFVHVLLSLVGIGCGFVVMSGLLGGRERNGWTALFLITTLATSVTGFGFPFDHLLPSHVVGIVSLAVLAVAILARYGLLLRGAWRWIYVVSAAAALYLNVFVGVAQAFLKVRLISTTESRARCTRPPSVHLHLFDLA
jgi:CHASE2 domain-containing sensor protein